MRNRNRTRPRLGAIPAGLGTIVVVMGLAACGGSPPPAPPVVAPPPAVTSTTAPSTTAPSTPTTTDPPVADPPTTAADGTNYAACASRPCEVSVRGAVTIPVRGGRIRVTGVAAKGLDLEATVNGSTTTGTVTGCGSVLEVGDGTGFTGCRDDRRISPLEPSPGTVAVQAANRVGSTFILRIAAG